MGKHVQSDRDWCQCSGEEVEYAGTVCTDCGRIWGYDERIPSPVQADVMVIAYAAPLEIRRPIRRPKHAA